MNILLLVITLFNIISRIRAQKVYAECFIESDEYSWQPTGSTFSQKNELEEGFTHDMEVMSYGWCNLESDQFTLHHQSRSYPQQTLTLSMQTGYTTQYACVDFKPVQIIAYYGQNDSLTEVVAKSATGVCFGLLKGQYGCNNVQRLHSHEFFFDQTHPWVGFHGQKQDGMITSLGLIIYDSENVRCKPYSDQFLISLMQVFTIFDRDGNGEINSFELNMLEEYFQAFGD